MTETLNNYFLTTSYRPIYFCFQPKLEVYENQFSILYQCISSPPLSVTINHFSAISNPMPQSPCQPPRGEGSPSGLRSWVWLEHWTRGRTGGRAHQGWRCRALRPRAGPAPAGRGRSWGSRPATRTGRRWPPSGLQTCRPRAKLVGLWFVGDHLVMVLLTPTQNQTPHPNPGGNREMSPFQTNPKRLPTFTWVRVVCGFKSFLKGEGWDGLLCAPPIQSTKCSTSSVLYSQSTWGTQSK